MKLETAVKTALDSMTKEIRGLTLNANLFDVYKCETPACIEASKRRKILIEAKALLKPLAGTKQ